MTDFIFNPRINHPFVLTDGTEGTILIAGVSIPDDPNSFFMPLQTWIDDYLTNQADRLTINFEMYYYNQTTSNYFFQLLKSIKEHTNNGKTIDINWYYYTDDEDIQEDGEDLKDSLNMPINIIEHHQPNSFSQVKTEETPLVYFDPIGDIIIEGNCIGRRPWEYFYPLIKWAENMRFTNGQLSISIEVGLTDIDELNLHYIKHIFNLLKIIDKKDDKTVQVVWRNNNEVMQNIGYDILNENRLKHKFINYSTH
jgi:hypothetical protein